MWTRQSNAPLGRWNCCSGLGWTLNHPAMNWAGPVRYKGGDTQGIAETLKTALEATTGIEPV
jgi:hypothetical protein